MAVSTDVYKGRLLLAHKSFKSSSRWNHVPCRWGR